MKTLFAVLILALGVGAVAVSQAAFIVRQTEQSILFQFGRTIKVINSYEADEKGKVTNNAGLYWKIPFVQNVVTYDKRVLDLDTAPKAVIVSGPKRILVDSFVRFQIVNPLLFYKKLKTEGAARRRLDTILDSALRRVLGSATIQDVIHNKRSDLMKQILAQVGREAKSLGIRVVDVRIKRADLPEANSEAIYARMVKEREQEAAGFRAEGAAAANRIRATADRQATVIRAEATKNSEIMRGEGDAERNRIFADAYQKDSEFFAFYRSMQAYETGLGTSGTRMLISPKSDFFKYFDDPAGKPKQQ